MSIGFKVQPQNGLSLDSFFGLVHWIMKCKAKVGDNTYLAFTLVLSRGFGRQNDEQLEQITRTSNWNLDYYFWECNIHHSQRITP